MTDIIQQTETIDAHKTDRLQVSRSASPVSPWSFLPQPATHFAFATTFGTERRWEKKNSCIIIYSFHGQK